MRRAGRVRNKPETHTVPVTREMPVVIARDPDDPEEADVIIVIPRRGAIESPGGGWQWDEVTVACSAIEGFGLFTCASNSLDWARPPNQVYIPIVGRETELGSAIELDIFVRVLSGAFIEFPVERIAPAPLGSCWATNGVYVELIAIELLVDGWRRPYPRESLLQVHLQPIINCNEPDACVYLLKEAALRLTHMPDHIFAVLAAHSQHHHADRDFATHTVSYRLASDVHMLVNAHPICAHPAAP